MILQIISKHLDKHNIPHNSNSCHIGIHTHTTVINRHYGRISPHAIEIWYHPDNNTIQIINYPTFTEILNDLQTNKQWCRTAQKEIDLEDPELYPKILQAIT